MLGLSNIKSAFRTALTNKVMVAGVPVPVHDLFPIQAIGEYIHIGDLTGMGGAVKRENVNTFTQTIRCIYEFNLQSKNSTINLDTISDSVHDIMMALGETSVTGYYLIEMELGGITTTELVADNGRRLAIHELKFNFKLQED